MGGILDAVHGNIYISEDELRILSTSIFNRLHHIKQLGQVYLEYPSATHTRYAHSIGVMHLAGDLYYHAVQNAIDVCDPCGYLRKAENELVNIIHNVNDLSAVFRNDILPAIGVDTDPYLLLYLEQDEYYNNLMDYMYKLYINDNKINFRAHRCGGVFTGEYDGLTKNQIGTLYYEYRLARLVGLLHDVGHLPLSHLMEGVIADHLFRYHNNKYIPKTPHEVLARTLIKEIYKESAEINKDLYYSEYSARSKSNNSANSIDIITLNSYLVPEVLRNNKYKLIYQVISNDYDVDKLDYVLRDKMYINGIRDPFMQDMLSVIKNSLILEDESRNCVIAYDSRDINYIKSILSKRRELYGEYIGSAKNKLNELYYKIVVGKLLHSIHTPVQEPLFSEENSEEKKTKKKMKPLTKENQLYKLVREISNNLDHIKEYNRLSKTKDTSDIMIKLTDEWLQVWLTEVYTLLINVNEIVGFDKDDICSKTDKNDNICISKMLKAILNGIEMHYHVWDNTNDYKKLHSQYISDILERDDIKKKLLYIVDSNNGIINNESRHIYKMELENPEYKCTYYIASVLSNLNNYMYQYYRKLYNNSTMPIKSYYRNIIERIEGILKEYVDKISKHDKISKYDILIYPNYYKPSLPYIYIYNRNIEQYKNKLNNDNQAMQYPPIYIYISKRTIKKHGKIIEENREQIYKRIMDELIQIIYEIVRG